MNRRAALKKSTLGLAGLGALPGLSVLLHSCQDGKASDYQPLHLTSDQFEVVRIVSDIIIPTTETPGADEAGVALYIDMLFGGYFEPDDQLEMMSGLEDFINECLIRYDKSFQDLNKDQQIVYLKDLDRSDDGQSFFKRLKGIVLWAYFTSEPGMKNMNYNPVPGKYDGCITIDENERLLVGNR